MVGVRLTRVPPFVKNAMGGCKWEQRRRRGHGARRGYRGRTAGSDVIVHFESLSLVPLNTLSPRTPPGQPFALGPPRLQASPASAPGVKGPGLVWSGRDRQEGSECGARPRTPASATGTPGAAGAAVTVGGRRQREARGSRGEDVPSGGCYLPPHGARRRARAAPGRRGIAQPQALEEHTEALTTGVYRTIRRGPPHRGQTSMSIAKTRFNQADQARPDARDGGGEPLPPPALSLGGAPATWWSPSSSGRGTLCDRQAACGARTP